MRICFLLFPALLLLNVTTAQAEEMTEAELAAEKAAAQKFRGWATKIQYHRNGHVRLVRFSKSLVQNKHLQPLAAFSQLEYLAVVCPDVTDEGLECLRSLTEVKSLLLSESGIGDGTLQSLSHMDSLERLYLADTNVSDAGLLHLTKLAQLKTLSLENTAVSDLGIAHLKSLTSLEVLWLSGTNISDASLEQLATLPKLRVLFLKGCNVTGTGLARLTDAPKLEYLSLTDVPVETSTLPALAGLTKLKQIDLYRTNLTAEDITSLQKSLSNTLLAVHPDLKRSRRKPTRSEETIRVAPKPVLPQLSTRITKRAEVPDFQRHVVPLLGKLGCNGRACHGSFQGQGGFRLSMFGYDFKMDHENITKRITLDDPKSSLFLNKPASEMEHEGGQRFLPDGWEQNVLQKWIEGGGKSVAANAPHLISLNVTPKEILFENTGDTAALKAVALWSDGTQEDVTALTRFQSNDEQVVMVNRTGELRSTGKGDTHIISYYDNAVVSTPVMLAVSDRTGDRYPQVPTPTRIDELVVQKLRKLGIVPAPLCSDEDFLRRVSLDLIGTLPTPTQIHDFLAETSPNKRTKKVEELLEHPAYVTWWTMRLCDLTGSNAGYLGSTEMAQPTALQWRNWLERRVQENVGWDRIVKGMVLARSRPDGQPYEEFMAEQSQFTRTKQPADYAALDRTMPHFWYRDNITRATDKALAFGYTFMGVRLDCAQCHKHPFDQWSQQDFNEFTEFFTRIQRGVARDAQEQFLLQREMLGVPTVLNTAALRRQSYLRIAAEGRPIPWREISIKPAPDDKPQIARVLGGPKLDLRHYHDPREPLMEWLLTEPNQYLARAFVNRIWASYFHRGIVNPPDDLNLANPPSNPELLDDLVARFIEHKYDMKWLHREILTSRTYQLSWEPNETNHGDTRNFSRKVLRRLPAEVAMDAVIQATASDAALGKLTKSVANRKIGQHPRSYQTRSIDFSLLVFGKTLRTTNCDCERKNEPTLLQGLYMRNDQETFARLDRPDGWLAQVAKEQKLAEEPKRYIRTAYLRTLSRQPTEAELNDCLDHLQTAPDVYQGLRDVMWGLLNTQEFITNH